MWNINNCRHNPSVTYFTRGMWKAPQLICGKFHDPFVKYFTIILWNMNAINT